MKKITQELINLFVDTDANSPDSCKPTIHGSYLYATNRIIAIKVPVEKLGFDSSDLPQNKFPELESLFDTLKTTPFDEPCILNKAVWELGKTKPETIIVRPEILCKECEQSGQVEWKYEAKTGKSYEASYDCPVCSGTGIEVEAKHQLTGKMTFKDHKTITFYHRDKSLGFDPLVFDTIFKVVDFFEMPLQVASHLEKNKGLAFRIKDYCDIIIMPKMAVELSGNGIFTPNFGLHLYSNGEATLWLNGNLIQQK